MDRSSRVPSHIVVPTYKNRMEELDGYPRTTEQEKEVDERVGEDDVHETPQLADTTMEGQLMHPPAEKAAAADTQDESSQESTEASFAGTNPEEGLLLLGQMTQSSQQSQAFHQQQQFYPPGPSITQQWEQATNLQNNPALRMEAWRANQFAHPPPGPYGTIGYQNSPSLPPLRQQAVAAPAPYVGGTHEAALPPSDPNKRKKNKKATAKKSTKKPTSSGTAGKGTQYTEEELLHIATLFEDHLPIGKISFRKVETLYNQAFPKRTRTASNLKRRFRTMVDEKMPTGDPDMPDHIRIAKRAHYKTIEKANASHGLSSDEEEPGENDDEAEEEEDDSGEQAGDSPAAVSAGASISTAGASGTKKKKKKAKNTKTRGSGSSSEQLLNAMLLNQEERRLREESRARKEDRAARRNQEFFMQVFSTAVTAFTTAFGGAAAAPHTPVAAPPRPAGTLQIDSEDEDGDTTDTLSSVSSSDSLHLKRDKLRQTAHRQRRAKNAKKKSASASKKRKRGSGGDTTSSSDDSDSD